MSDFLILEGHLRSSNICKTLKCGGDIWWTAELLLKQLTKKVLVVPPYAFGLHSDVLYQRSYIQNLYLH